MHNRTTVCHLVRAPINERGSLHVRGEESMDRVFLGQLTVHADHRGFQNHMRVAQVGHRFVDAGNGEGRSNGDAFWIG